MDSITEQIERMYELKVKLLQQLLLQYQIHLFPQGLEDSQSYFEELIQMIKDSDNMNREVNNILALTTDQFRSILDYEANHQIYVEFENKVREYQEIKANICEAQKKINEMQNECPILSAYIGNNLLRDQNKILRLEDIYTQLNQIRQQAIQEIRNVTFDRNSMYEIIKLRCPPQPALIDSQIIVILLNNQASQNNIWAELKVLISKPNEFLVKLQKFQIEKQPRDKLNITKSLFESLNEDQCRRCSLFIYNLYKWCECQFAIAMIYNNYNLEIFEIENHKQALKFKEKIKEFVQKSCDLEKYIQKYQDYCQPIKQDYEEKAIQLLQAVKFFEELKIIIRPKQYGITMTNYLIKILEQEQYTNEQTHILLDEIITKLFPSYTILHQQIPQLPYSSQQFQIALQFRKKILDLQIIF